MNEEITVVRVPTGLPVPVAMQEAQDRLLARFGDTPPHAAQNLQVVVNNPKTALLFAVAGSAPQSLEDWQEISTDQYVGTLTLIMVQTTIRNMAHIEHVVVESGHEGKGIGRKLVEKAIEIGHQNDVTRFDLTSSPDKEAAQVLYKKTGFKLRETNNWRFDG